MNRLVSRINPISLRAVYRKPVLSYRALSTPTKDHFVKNDKIFNQPNIASSFTTIKSINDTLNSEYQKLEDLHRQSAFPPNIKILAEQSISRFKNYNGLILSEINKMEHSLTNPANSINNIQPDKENIFHDIVKGVAFVLFCFFGCCVFPPLFFILPLIFIYFW